MEGETKMEKRLYEVILVTPLRTRSRKVSMHYYTVLATSPQHACDRCVKDFGWEDGLRAWAEPCEDEPIRQYTHQVWPNGVDSRVEHMQSLTVRSDSVE